MRMDPFYLVVDDVQWLERLLPLGVKLVQLRIKDRPENEIRSQIRAARELSTKFGAQLVINDFWLLALEEDCEFVHLGQGDLDGADTAALRAKGVKLGVSTHDEAELDRALSLSPDYIALGPIYPTLLKKMAFAPQGPERLGDWKRRIRDIPLVAIGGLTPERARLVLRAGADSACVVTDVLRNAEPESRAREWVEATANWRARAEFI